MTPDVLVPYVPGCAHRAAAWSWVQNRYDSLGWEHFTGLCADGPFNRAEAILDAARRSTADVVVIADADVWCEEIPAAVEAVEAGEAWAVPHRWLHRLSPESTELVLAGADWRGLPLSSDNRQDRRPYRARDTGALVVMCRDILERVPPDARFVGWGQEDDAWATALRTIVGPAWHGDGDLVHCWHPPQPRMTRQVGNEASLALFRRYRHAMRDRRRMLELLDEARAVEVNQCAPPR